MGNLRSEFRHARPSGSPVIRYVRHGRTKATLIARFPMDGGTKTSRAYYISEIPRLSILMP